MEVGRYLRIPFAYSGADWSECNCYGLIVLAYREELGIGLPLFDDIPSTSLRAAARKIKERGKTWDQVDGPQPFDVVLMRGHSVINGRSFGVNCHVGLVIDGGQIMHTEEGVGVTILPIDDPLIAHRIVEFRRYVCGS